MRRRNSVGGGTGSVRGGLRQNSPLGTRIALSSLVQALAVAEQLNFRRAAEALGVSQSSVSQRVKALETELGVMLFERGHRGVRLTEAGRIFLDEIAIGIEHLDHAVAAVGNLAQGSTGRLRVGIHGTIAAGFLTELLRRQRRENPEIDVSLIEGRASENITAIREGKIDIAFVAGNHSVEDCHSHLFWQEEIIVALPADHILCERPALSWSDLASETFLARYSGTGRQVHDHVVRRLVERGFEPKIRRCEVGRDTLMHLVAGGEGVTLRTEAAMHDPVAGVSFRRIVDEEEPASFRAVWSPYNRSQILRKFLARAKEIASSFQL